MLNIGILTPNDIVEKTLKYAEENNISIESLEGFIRQVIGWREFMRGTYTHFGRDMRTKNVWNHTRKMRRGFLRYFDSVNFSGIFDGCFEESGKKKSQKT